MCAIQIAVYFTLPYFLLKKCLDNLSVVLCTVSKTLALLCAIGTIWHGMTLNNLFAHNCRREQLSFLFAYMQGMLGLWGMGDCGLVVSQASSRRGTMLAAILNILHTTRTRNAPVITYATLMYFDWNRCSDINPLTPAVAIWAVQL